MKLTPTLALLACVCTAGCFGGYTPLAFSVEGERIIANGVIDGTSQAAFEAVSAAHPQARTLVLQNIAGSVDDVANVIFARAVRAQGFDTVVPGDGMIASGGTDLFLAGVGRVLEPGACVGVHSWAASDYTATDIPRSDPEHERYLTYYDEMGIARAFYWYTIEAAPAEEIYWMRAEEVAQYALTTQPVTRLSQGATCDAR